MILQVGSQDPGAATDPTTQDPGAATDATPQAGDTSATSRSRSEAGSQDAFAGTSFRQAQVEADASAAQGAVQGEVRAGGECVDANPAQGRAVVGSIRCMGE